VSSLFAFERGLKANMAQTRFRSVLSVVTVAAVLMIAGARALHSEFGRFEQTVTKSSTTNPGPCWLCDTPDCALLPSAVVINPFTITLPVIDSDEADGYVRLDDIEHQIRPPPAV